MSEKGKRRGKRETRWGSGQWQNRAPCLLPQPHSPKPHSPKPHSSKPHSPKPHSPQPKAPQPKAQPFGVLLTGGHWVLTPGHLLSALLSLPVWHSLLSLLHVAVFAANSGRTSCSCVFQCAGSVVTLFLCGDSLVFSCDSAGSLKSCLIGRLA